MIPTNSFSTKQKIKTIVALLVAVFIPFGLMLWFRIHQTSDFTSIEIIVYPLLFGSIGIGAVFMLHQYFLKDTLYAFQASAFQPSYRWLYDVGWGVILTIIYFIMFFVERLTLTNLLASHSNTELLGLMLDMRKNIWMLFLWFGPVLWIGIALYEELIRTFILHHLWKWSSRPFWIITCIVLTSALIGLTHWSQGSYGIVTIGIKSIVSCTFFYYQRKLMPLVYAHVLYDGLQVSMLLLTYPE